MALPTLGDIEKKKRDLFAGPAAPQFAPQQSGDPDAIMRALAPQAPELQQFNPGNYQANINDLSANIRSIQKVLPTPAPVAGSGNYGSFGDNFAPTSQGASGRFGNSLPAWLLAALPVMGKYSISQGDTTGHSTGGGGHAWDFAVPTGTRVFDSEAGQVIKTADLGNRSYGKYVMVRGNDGRIYIFAHLSSIGVRPGEKLTAHQYLGLSGATGDATGPHLHFEYRG